MQPKKQPRTNYAKQKLWLLGLLLVSLCLCVFLFNCAVLSCVVCVERSVWSVCCAVVWCVCCAVVCAACCMTCHAVACLLYAASVCFPNSWLKGRCGFLSLSFCFPALCPSLPLQIIVGSFSDFAALAFAAQSIVAPLVSHLCQPVCFCLSRFLIFLCFLPGDVICDVI